VELAVMTELLLRGDQTVGELRGRAARMEPIADLAVLKPLLESLVAQKLVVYLTPPGRGCVVTHTLYQPNELDKLRSQYASGSSEIPKTARPATAAVSPAAATPTAAASHPLQSQVDALRQELDQCRTELGELRSEIAQFTQNMHCDVDRIKQATGVEQSSTSTFDE